MKTPDCLMGNTIMSGNLAKRLVILTDTAHHVWPFFLWDGIVRPTWTWMLLGGDDRGKTAKHLLKRKEFLMKLTMGGEKVDQHW